MVAEYFLVHFLIASSTIFLAIFVTYKWKYQYWKRKNANYLKPKIPFGNAVYGDSIGVSSREAYKEMKKRGWKHGGIFVVLAPLYVVVDLEYVKKIIVSDFTKLSLKGFYVDPEIEPLGNHLVACTGERWKAMRTNYLTALTEGKMKKFIFNDFLKSFINFEDFLENSVSMKHLEVLEINTAFECILTDFVANYVLGLRINSFDGTCKENIFRKVTRQILCTKTVSRKVNDFLAIFLPESLSKIVGVRQFPKEVSDFFMPIIKDSIEYREKNKIFRQDFLQTVLELKNNKTLNKFDDIAAQCFMFFIASIESTANSLGFAIYEIANDGNIQERLRREIKETIDGPISYDSIKNLTYLNQVISETLRKYPAFPMSSRKTTEKYQLDDNLELDAGTFVIYSTFGIHHDEEYYPDPEKFDPERFTEENSKSRPKFAYLPFGDGPRKCIGGRLALMIMRTILVSLLRKYKFSVNKEKTVLPFKYAESSVLTIEGGIWVNVEKLIL